MKVSYYAIFQYDPDGLWIRFPDLHGCFSCGDNDDEGIKMAKEAMELYIEGIPIDKLPKPSTLEQIKTKDNQKVFLISCEIMDE